ncbi:glycoside hydrolase family 3 C-terminal domain-containing protein [Candidatus Soleaferrea massiliensis]|uniref:glycoside hydrolase family 3 C-terminal domain-containing protein n=1 Tax=Candidatus Soleaferrea massiliensis TaxID=1470354 RepID=UPI000A5149C9|nr:glycoside hydrolase family 3 C-terminal domain-containing protein [Candidatus Soleaferrea massiliensis]
MKRFKRLVCAVLSCAMIATMVPASFVSAEELPGLSDVSRQAAAEGAVLLKNENDTLPVGPDEEISVFGRVQIDYFRTGYGSGGYVHPSKTVNFLEGFRQNPNIKVNEELAGIYEDWCKKNPASEGSGWGNWPYYHAEMPLTDEIVDAAAKVSGTAVVVIGRAAGEDRECKLQEGSYYLTKTEKEMLAKVTAKFDKVAVLLNIGNIIDMSWTRDYDIDAILLSWQGGMEGGKAAADVISGDVTPSGKLAATIANTYNDYPSAKNFGGANYNNYAEDIFVGYRYFETFAPEDVMYGFGYGLSYTDFSITTNSVTAGENAISVDVTVENTGSVKGKEVVQVYYGAPQGKLGKAAKSLAAYAKTGVLYPGETQDMTLTFQIDSMTSYDDAGKTGRKSAYVLEAGNYPIYVGDSVRGASEQGVYTLDTLKVVEQLEEALAPVESFDRMTAFEQEDGTIGRQSEAVPLRVSDLYQRIEDNLPDEIAFTGDLGYTLADVQNGSVSIEQFVAQLEVADLARLCRGAGGMQSSLGRPGNAGVFGGVESNLRDMGISPISCCDGPSGIRMRDSDAASLVPIGSALASTWNDELVERVYNLLGQELNLNEVDVLLAPGMNIQRDVLAGRNFEYFSEDPLITGMMGAAVTRGVQSTGAAVCAKHFAANNQETNRKKHDSRVSERALREIYLKGFEICVKTANPYTIMSAYNKINGVFCCYNYDLMTTILREEWGWDGVVMTDWSMQPGTDPNNANITDNAYRVQAQVDLYMPGNYSNDSIENSISKGGLTTGEVQRSVVNILNYVLKSPKFARDNGLEPPVYVPGENYFSVRKDASGDPRLTQLTIDGKKISTFNPLIVDYNVFTRDFTQLPVVAAGAADGVSLRIEQATAENPVASVYTSEGREELIYRVRFSDDAFMPPVVENPTYAYLRNIYVDGQPLAGFYSSIYEYETISSNVANPVITVDAPDGVDAAVSYDPDTQKALIRAQSNHQAVEYTVQFTAGPQSDDFDGDALQDFWTVNDRNGNLSVQNGALNIITEYGDIYGPNDHLKNWISQPAGGNWDAVTKLSFDKLPSDKYHQLGLMIMQDKDNYIHFRFENAGNLRMRLNQETNGTSKNLKDNTSYPSKISDTLYMKVTKRGTTYNFYMSVDGVNYTDMGTPVTANYVSPKFVLASMNGTGEISPIHVQYDYVHFEMEQAEEHEPVVISASQPSRIKAAEDYTSISSGLITENCTDEGGGLNVGSAAVGRYLLYNIDVEKDGYYEVSPRIASNRDSLYQMQFGIEVDGQPAASFMQLGGTGGWQNWITMDPQKVYLTAGSHKLKFYYNCDGLNINWLQFDYMAAHAVTAAPVEGTEVVFSQTEAVRGDTVTFSIHVTDESMALDSVKAMSGEDEVNIRKRGDGSYTFEMPDGPVVVSIQLKTLESDLISDSLAIDRENGYLADLTAGMTADEILSQLSGTNGGTVAVADQDGNAVTGDRKIGTGFTVSLTMGETVLDSLTAVVMGDVTGEGQQGVQDLLGIKAHILGADVLEGAYLRAADMDHNGRINVLDLLRLKLDILNG